MNIKNLSLKRILGDDWVYNPDFQYADFVGKAELHKGDRIILFRKGDEQDISVVSLQAIGLGDKKLIQTANKMLGDIGINLRIGDKQNQIVKKYGSPDFIDYIEEGYYRYYNFTYDFRYDKFLITRYHYLLAPDLLVCFGTPKEHYQRLTEVEIVNDLQMVTAIMENRTACKKLGYKIGPSKDRLSFIHQTIKNRSIEGIQSEIVLIEKSEIENCIIKRIQANKVIFFESKITNCTIEEIQSKQVEYDNCVFQNVVFRNSYNKSCIHITRACTFENCTFHDMFEVIFQYVLDNKFQNCLFERISSGIKNGNEGAFLWSNEFFNCTFKEIQWVGNGLDSNVMNGGKMENIFYREIRGIEIRGIHKNQFINVQMKDIEVEMENTESEIEDIELSEKYSFSDNKLDSVTFNNVILQVKMGKMNKFTHCDTRGLKMYI